MKCPLCNGNLRISNVKKKIKGSLVNTGSKIEYCEQYNCGYEKVLNGSLPSLYKREPIKKQSEGERVKLEGRA